MIKEMKQKPIRYAEYWVLRAIRTNEKGNKLCVDEKYFSNPPTEQDIVDTLLIFPKDCFVSVEHNYRLVESEEQE